MAKRVQRRRGTSVEHNTFIGAIGEITVDTDKKVAVVHDNVTMGGYPMLRQDFDNVNPVQGRTALQLGTAAILDTGTLTGTIPLHTQNSPLKTAAYRDVAIFGSGNPGEVVTLEDTEKLPALDASQLYNLNLVDNVATQSNIHLTNIRLLKNITTPPNVFILNDGLVDGFDSTVGLDPSSFPAWNHDTVNNLVEVLVGTTTPLTSVMQQCLSGNPIKAIITIIQENVDSLAINTDLVAEVSRNDGTAWSVATLTDKGSFTFPSSPVRILVGSADLTTHPSTMESRWKITMPTSLKTKIYAVGVTYQYTW